MRRRRRSNIAMGIAVLLAFGGGSAVSRAVASQQDAPLPEVSTLSVPSAEIAVEVAQPQEAREGSEEFRGFRPEPEVEDEPAPVALPPSLPVSLRVPSIDVSSDLDSLGQTGTGEIQTPAGERYDQAGWYRFSPRPGSIGPSIIVGHVDSAENGPSVFFRLGEMRPGDRISVTRADGSEAVFQVDGLRRFAKKDFPTELVYGDINHAGLRLLTCGGAFNEAAGHYVDNIVVFASLVVA